MDHSIICPAYVSPLDKLSGVGPTGPCDCGAEEPKDPVAETPTAPTESAPPPTRSTPPPVAPVATEAPKTDDAKPVSACADSQESQFEPEPLVPASELKPTKPAAAGEATAEKPKRKRRTKEEIAADKAAKEAAKAAKEATKATMEQTEALKAAAKAEAGSAATPPTEAAPSASAAKPITLAEFLASFDELAQASGQMPRLEFADKLKSLKDRVAAGLVGPVDNKDLGSLQPGTAAAGASAALQSDLIKIERDELKAKVAALEAQIAAFQSKIEGVKGLAAVVKARGPEIVSEVLASVKPKKRVFLGIDPGLTGQQALIDEDLNVVSIKACPTVGKGTRRNHDLPGILAEARRYKELGIDTALVEQQQVFPKMGSFANFVKGCSKTAWEMALLANGIRFDTIRPISWKKAMGIAGGDPKAVKRKAIEKAQRLFPNADLRDTDNKPNTKKPSSDKAEALLLSLYVARMTLGEGPGTEAWKKHEQTDTTAAGDAEAAKRAALAELSARVSKGVDRKLLSKNLPKLKKTKKTGAKSRK